MYVILEIKKLSVPAYIILGGKIVRISILIEPIFHLTIQKEKFNDVCKLYMVCQQNHVYHPLSFTYIGYTERKKDECQVEV